MIRRPPEPADKDSRVVILHKKVSFISFLILFLFNSLLFSQVKENQSENQKILFKEIWGYVSLGEEGSFSADYPVTDVGHFAGFISSLSELAPVPKRSDRFPDFKGRLHLVTNLESKPQTHLMLDPKLPLRNKIIKQLVEQAKEYDGLQIDWESVLKADDENFWDFLKLLKKKLKGKMLTVAVPARVKKLEKDAYDYERISKIADRVIVMAYDEHWSTSAPGPIASIAWCKRIADYAKSVIPEEKLIMGCHFYSRAWNNEDVGQKAYRMYKIDDLIKSNKVTNFKKSKDGELSFTFEKKTKITVFYDTVESASARCRMYADQGISKLSFWRIGQEDPKFWNELKVER